MESYTHQGVRADHVISIWQLLNTFLLTISTPYQPLAELNKDGYEATPLSAAHSAHPPSSVSPLHNYSSLPVNPLDSWMYSTPRPLISLTTSKNGLEIKASVIRH